MRTEHAPRIQYSDLVFWGIAVHIALTWDTLIHLIPVLVQTSFLLDPVKCQGTRAALSGRSFVAHTGWKITVSNMHHNVVV